MKYIALLRGINVGGKNMISMKAIVPMFESMGFKEVSSYINTGNIFFEVDKADARSKTHVTNALTLTERISEGLRDEFNLDVPVLVKEMDEMKAIADAIPADWINKENKKSDVAYLFPSVDSPDVVEALPFNQDYIRVIYTKGALLWSLNMNDYSKSRLNKLVGSKLYASMTVRNVNTARRLAKG